MTNIDIITPLAATGEMPVVRRISADDVLRALAEGIDDFRAMPTHVLFILALYPVVGLLLGRMAFSNDVLPLLYPLAAGLALVGPFLAIGMYELSRRRALGLDTSWAHMLDVWHSPSLAPIIGIGVLLLLILGIWMSVAHGIYTAYLGPEDPQSVGAFVSDVLTTRAGREMIVIGNLVGLGFAIAAMALSVISLPLLLDRNVGAAVAITTSLRAVARNPVPFALWGLIVALGLLAGAVPFLIGLAIVVPVLGHATWHLYRVAVEPDDRPRPEYRPRPKVERSAADFPAVLLTLFIRPRRD